MSHYDAKRIEKHLKKYIEIDTQYPCRNDPPSLERVSVRAYKAMSDAMHDYAKECVEAALALERSQKSNSS